MNYWYFLKSSLDDVETKEPIYSDTYLGDVGDFYDMDGVGYIISDYAVEENIDKRGDFNETY